jgi:hypothetical protein
MRYHGVVDGEECSMPWFEVVWTPEIIDHIALHQVTVEDFESVLFAARRVFPNKVAGRFEVTGRTPSGRLLKCVFEPIDSAAVIPVTAFDPTE